MLVVKFIMIINVNVKSNSSQEKIVKINEKEYQFWLKEKPIENKVNIYLIKFLKKYFKKDVRIKFGFNSKKKIIEVYDEI